MTAPVTGTSNPLPLGAAAPTAADTSTPSNPSSALGKDDFLKLLVAQMKNQDPLNPSQGDQMAAELAQFSSLEQLQDINSTLTNQTTGTSTLIDTIQTNAAMGTIGKTVTAVGNTVTLPDGTDPGTIDVHATIGGSGGKGTLTILDANGNVIGTRELGVVNPGDQDFTLGDATKGLASGTYHYAIKVVDSTGATTSATTYVTGKVDSVTATSNGPVLMCGGLAIPFNTVTEIKG